MLLGESVLKQKWEINFLMKQKLCALSLYINLTSSSQVSCPQLNCCFFVPSAV